MYHVAKFRTCLDNYYHRLHAFRQFITWAATTKIHTKNTNKFRKSTDEQSFLWIGKKIPMHTKLNFWTKFRTARTFLLFTFRCIFFLLIYLVRDDVVSFLSSTMMAKRFFWKKTWNLISLRKKMLAIIFRNVLQSVFWECIWFSLAAENGISFPSWKFHVQLHGNQLISIIFALQRRILQWKNFQMSSYRRQCVMISWFGMTCHRTIWYRTKVCILFDFVQN